jgi:23S rRNA pseudouridine1911/1915/1917 synthase
MTPMSRHERLTVPPESEGQRLDRFVTERVPLTRSQVQRLVRSGLVTVDGRRTKTGHPVEAGQRVEVEIPPPEPTDIVAQSIALRIVHEDDDIIVVDKPPGLVVHPGAGNPDGTLVNALVHHCPEIEGVGGVRRPGLVHRLDKDTSGLMVAAKRHEAFLALVDSMGRGRLGRTYLALVWGDPGVEGEIDAPIGRDPRNRKRMAVRPGGRAARTTFRSLGRFDFASFVELTLVTGRTHQIRVHMAHVGCPVLGDPLYRGRTHALSRVAPEKRRRARAALGRIERQALHAWRLVIEHPTSRAVLEFEAAPPGDFTDVLEYVKTMSTGSG